MELPKTKGLKSFSWGVIIVSAFETFVITPGSLFEKAGLSALSCITVLIGFIVSCFIVDGYVRWLKMNQTFIEHKHRQNIEDIAILFFYFGIIGSTLLVMIYPLMEKQHVSFSVAPTGVGFLLGAKWISAKYNPPHKSTWDNVTYLNR